MPRCPKRRRIRDAKRDIGAELLESVRAFKVGKAVVVPVEMSIITEAAKRKKPREGGLS